MQIIIHRGTQEIGGTCVEVIANQTRILLDFGMPLGDGRGGEFDERALEGQSIEDLIAQGILYPIQGLYKNNTSKIDAILISHSHKDHYGFLKFAHPDIPIYISVGSQKLIEALNIFIRKEDRLQLPQSTKTVQDRQSFHIVDKTTGQSLFYSGDFRSAGWKSKLFDRFVAKPPKNVDCLLMEGTMMNREGGQYPTEEDVYKRTTEILTTTTNQVAFACCSGQNIDRVVSFYKAARKAGAILVIDPYIACILNVIKTPMTRIPQMDWEGIRVLIDNYFGGGDLFVGKIARSPRKNLLPQLAHAKISHRDFAKLHQKALVLMRTSLIPAIEKIPGIQGSKMIYSQWKGYLAKDTPDAQRFKSFVNQFEMDLEYVHTSGHATVDKLKTFADAVDAKCLVPIHTAHANQYRKLFNHVKILKDGEEFDLSAVRG